MLSDRTIRKYCTLEAYHRGRPMIEPFSEAVSGDGVISYGLTSAGYDLRLCPKRILVFNAGYGQRVNPKKFNDPEYRRKAFLTIDHLKVGDEVVIPPNGYILGQTVERFWVPRRLKGRVVGKSTYARSGILINTTPAEPEWGGTLTLEIGNITPCQATVFVGEGIAQMEFEMIDEEVECSYADKNGKYQHQTEVTPARVL